MQYPKDCTCEVCRAACEHKPGWFLPGQAEMVADYLGITLGELFNEYLAVDYWLDEQDIFVLAPATKTITPGVEYPADPHGECVFYHDGLCSIHDVKPHECKLMHHSTEEGGAHHATALEWQEHQDQIAELLGHEPEADYSFGGIFDFLFSSFVE